ncbi:MAG: GDP-mannose dehydrogenase, partial [Planctomycetes bacterium]|nr:GDP-mannose dehydrogenase [Planctomycetota bacterium]
MKIAVFGLGYVGTVCGACFAADGHQVIGVEVNPEKLALVEAGRSPIVEPGLDEILSESVRSGRLTVTADTHAAVSAADVSLICVGTPSRADGSLNLDFVLEVCAQIGDALKTCDRYHVVTIRSTVL